MNPVTERVRNVFLNTPVLSNRTSANSKQAGISKNSNDGGLTFDNLLEKGYAITPAAIPAYIIVHLEHTPKGRPLKVNERASS